MLRRLKWNQTLQPNETPLPVHRQAVKKGVDLTVAAAANTEISFGAVCYANEINANQINHTAPVITDKPTPA